MSFYIPVVKVQLVKERQMSCELKQIRCSEDIAKLMFDYLEGTDRENFVVVMLNTKHKIIGINTVSIGILDASIVHPREVYKPAILAGASAVIVVHNHPSGDVTESPEDIAITQRLAEAGKLLGVDFLDHIIIGDYRHSSLKQKGYF